MFELNYSDNFLQYERNIEKIRVKHTSWDLVDKNSKVDEDKRQFRDFI